MESSCHGPNSDAFLNLGAPQTIVSPGTTQRRYDEKQMVNFSSLMYRSSGDTAGYVLLKTPASTSGAESLPGCSL